MIFLTGTGEEGKSTGRNERGFGVDGRSVGTQWHRRFDAAERRRQRNSAPLPR